MVATAASSTCFLTVSWRSARPIGTKKLTAWGDTSIWVDVEISQSATSRLNCVAEHLCDHGGRVVGAELGQGQGDAGPRLPRVDGLLEGTCRGVT